jgi:hypothetical protein
LIYLCCANCVVNKNGHVINDVLLYHAHTYFAWSLLCEGTRGFLSWFLPPLHNDGELSSRTTLFQAGGDDVARPMVVATSSTISSSPTYAKSPWTSKVNHIRYTSLFPPHVNGILLHTPSYDIARFTSTSTETWEEARSLKSDVMEAWKRMRKKLDRSLRTQTGVSGPTQTGVSGPSPTGVSGPLDIDLRWTPGMPLVPVRSLTGALTETPAPTRQTGVSGPRHRSLRPKTDRSLRSTDTGVSGVSGLPARRVLGLGPCNSPIIPKLPLARGCLYISPHLHMETLE